jgi:hemoglobin
MLPMRIDPFRLLVLAIAFGTVGGCGTSQENSKEEGFFTSGSREADQRATQRMAKDQQLAGRGAGEGDNGEGGIGKAEKKLTLFERLGGETGVTAIVDDFVERVLKDPRVNWSREGVKQNLFSFRPKRDPDAWNPSPENATRLKKHMAQFLTLATGGPAKYDGKEMKSVHEDMRIENSEFDAAVGDLKATLDRLQLPDKAQKELLAIVESTRPQVVTVR